MAFRPYKNGNLEIRKKKPVGLENIGDRVFEFVEIIDLPAIAASPVFFLKLLDISSD